MIKAVITDVDGVLTGNKVGFNFPHSTPEVITALHQVSKKGIPVVLCTAKIGSAIEDIIIDADLRSPHISDGGAFIFDLLDKKIINEHLINTNLAQQIIAVCIEKGIHCSAHTVKDVFIDKTHNQKITQKRMVILKRELTVVDSLTTHMASQKTIKLTLTILDKSDMGMIEEILKPFIDKINFIWTHNPMSDPWKYGVISSAGISKLSASQEVAKLLGIDMTDILGVGDSIADWAFMQECGYVAVVGEKSPELADLAQTKGEGRHFLAPSVDENGMVDIFKYYHLI